MLTEEPAKVIILHETKWQSWSKDFVTYGFMISLLIINHLFLGGDTLIDCIFIGMIILFFMTNSSANTHVFYSYQTARDYINNLEVDKL